MIEFLIDVIFAAIAGLGFSYAICPPKHVLAYCSLLGGLGYATRLMLLKTGFFSLAGATLIASIGIGVCAVYFGKKLKTPIEVVAFPSLLPMIPGLYAYKSILAIFLFMKSPNENDKVHHIVQFFNNSFITISVAAALTVGISIVLLFFYEASFSMTRDNNLKNRFKDELSD
ncbi:threonine/serine exporter family protein [Campylobacter geochelonis]|uniref:Membrane protein n=1 Tax=Campylobacter geochelonis TaxID=1780362 RepID=A0A128EHW8_9BACT|nr:threonine/serine exporter family protein [Campylobacter geochelonis]QKF71767.1 putative threonine/serine exporter, ThrE family (DUF3815 domain) [Campylobacter geochelonis]CZE47557.1 membrane protein [Campylobacter geochelonis]CZE48485.1 membrane protein [Campylobacter geochelonis]CZE51185.1 membrane protein [Campylobacter geochelonis]